jgi:lipopolysaccharide biosynthesis glycosyltransferase
MKKNLILTFSQNQTELTSLTYPFLERYAENHNLDLIIMREECTSVKDQFDLNNVTWSPSYNRLIAYDLFNIYDRILWIGSDVLVQPYAPNIFDIVPDNMVGAYVEHYKGEWHHAGDICGDCFNAFGMMPDQYINIDVMLLDRSLKEIYNYHDNSMILNITKGKWLEQDYMNYYIKQNDIPLFDLGYTWNCMISKYIYTNTNIPNDWNFMHVTGIDYNSRISFLHDYLTKNEMI